MSDEAREQAGFRRRTAIVYLVLSALLWSLGGPLIKLVEWNPLAIAGARSAIAAVVIVAFFGRARFTWSAAQVGGAAAYACTVILFVIATKLTTAANAILLQYTAPVYVAIFGRWFLGERTRRLDWVIIIIVLAGMALFFLDGLKTEGFWGNLCAIASGLSFAWLVLFMRKQKNGSPVESVLLGNILAALVGLPFAFGSLPGRFSWLGLLLLGVFQLGISYVFYSKAIKHVTALEAILIPVIEPILNPVWVLLLTGERAALSALAGGAIVILAITGRGLFGVTQAVTGDR